MAIRKTTTKRTGGKGATRRTEKGSKEPLSIVYGLPPRDAVVSTDPKVIARAPVAGCDPCIWHNIGSSLVAGQLRSITQQGRRLCWVYVPTIDSHGRITYYKVSWEESCGGPPQTIAW
jgi:hypothetical protein